MSDFFKTCLKCDIHTNYMIYTVYCRYCTYIILANSTTKALMLRIIISLYSVIIVFTMKCINVYKRCIYTRLYVLQQSLLSAKATECLEQRFLSLIKPKPAER